MHCHCGANNRAPRRTFMNPCKPEVRPSAREESASPAWLAAPAMNARDTTKVYIHVCTNFDGPNKLFDLYHLSVYRTLLLLAPHVFFENLVFKNPAFVKEVNSLVIFCLQ